MRRAVRWRGIHAMLTRIAVLHLDRRVLNLELRFQCVRYRLQQRVVGVVGVHDQMHRQRRFGRAHAPDVQVVDVLDAGQCFEIRAHRADIDVVGHRVHGQIERFAQEAQAAHENQRREGQRDDRIHPEPAGRQDDHPVSLAIDSQMMAPNARHSRTALASDASTVARFMP